MRNQLTDYYHSVYAGNLVPYCTQNDLMPVFQPFGYIVEIRMQADRGFAFVKMDTHENAAMAIVHLQGTPIHGRGLKCSWGKDKAGEALPAAQSVREVVITCASRSLIKFVEQYAQPQQQQQQAQPAASFPGADPQAHLMSLYQASLTDPAAAAQYAAWYAYYYPQAGR